VVQEHITRVDGTIDILAIDEKQKVEGVPINPAHSIAFTRNFL
jgi:hypothetical protein